MNMSLQQSQPMHFANMKRTLQPSKATRAQPRNGRVQKTQRAKAKDRQARTRAQHARRMRCRAADLVVQVIAQLLRLQVLVITSMSAATEVARMKVMVATMKSRRLTVPDIVGVLFLDFAARAPDLSMAFHRMVAKRPLPKGRAKSCGIQLFWSTTHLLCLRSGGPSGQDQPASICGTSCAMPIFKPFSESHACSRGPHLCVRPKCSTT